MSPLNPKQVVQRFNQEVIQEGRRAAFDELVAPQFVNRSAPAGAPDGPEGLWNTFDQVLRPALSDLRVTIHDQVCEGDKVTTRKTVSGRHTATLMGVPPTGRELAIEVIDIVRVQGGQYVEHWGINTLPSVLARLQAARA
ncbi:ester cyclase [Roseateles terrae]|uniref:SnoaL-like aldol condensation-catalyzing enzyme n=1 Tax=Roseateles terrae TaxID=431060 RepID=A0ABR6GTT9_9BURK|nr:ester cyclase [Roseateles terrae]MBB3195117.1 putative SnoaL-like aldol condensation-catalyzing enzyme [Roseateles terrae]OWQ87143.1 ester cyclase [Roseateles terrae]